MSEVVVNREVDASQARLWNVLVDVVSWPRWTSSMTSVRLLDGGLARGRRARVRQPWLPVLDWTVTDLQHGRSFTWSAGGVGVTSVGTHEVHRISEATSRLTLTLEHQGPLAPVIDLLLGARSRRYVELEATGLKLAAESAPR